MLEKIRMPEDIVQAYHENKAMDAQPLNCCQLVWMAHWKHTNYKSETQDCSHLSIDCESGREAREDSVAEQDNVQGRSDAATDISTSIGAIREATKATKVSIMNENLPENPGNLRIGSLDFKSFPISEKRDGTLSLKRGQCAIYHREVPKSLTDTSFRNNIVYPRKAEIHLHSEGFLPPNQLMNSSNAIEKNKLIVSASMWSDVRSNPDMVPYAYSKGKSSMPSFMHGQRQIYQSSYNLASREHFTSNNCQSYSSLLIHEKKISNPLDPQTSGFSRLMSSGPDHAQYNPSARHDGGLNFVSDHRWKMLHYGGTARFSSLTCPFESIEIDNSFHGRSPALKMPDSVHDAKTMKIFTPIDLGEESSRGHPKILKITHHFPIAKSSDIILSEKGQLFRESVIATKFKRNAFSEIPYFSQPTGENALGSVKLKTGSSMNWDGKRSVQDLEGMTILENESSAETDTMDINALQEDQHPGDVTLSSNKCPRESQNSLTCPGAITSAREGTKAESENVAIHDANQEPLKLHTLTGPLAERETSTSKTQSLDVEHLLSHATEHGNSKSSTCGDGSFGPEPSSRWLKRLKLSTSDSALGTKSEKIGETSPCENVPMIFSKIMKGRETSLEPKIISLTEGLKVPDLLAMVSSNGRSSIIKANQTAEAALSHPWIQRWSHNPASSSLTKHDTTDLDPLMEGFPKKQFPSIAAMALMGKAMGSLRPCEFVKKGPLVVWNTEIMKLLYL